MRLGAERPRCKACGGTAEFEREVPPVGDTPAVRIFRCAGCDIIIGENVTKEKQPERHPEAHRGCIHARSAPARLRARNLLLWEGRGR
jgi:hypothetical protein